MIFKKKIFFIPDLSNKSGLGHYFRCLKYSNFFKEKFVTYILIEKNKSKQNLLFKKKNNKFIFFNNLESKIRSLLNKENLFFIDSYNTKKIKLINRLTKNTITTADKLMKLNSKYIIDHTFLRNKEDHKKNNLKSIIYSNHLYFPFIDKKFLKTKKYIMINFGTNNSINDILNVIKFVKRLKLDSKYKILIIDKNFKLNLLKKYNIKKIKLINYTNNLDNYYSKTFICFGACGISLYERAFNGIPSICKPIVKNQIYNYKNFLRKKCILDYNSIITNKKLRIDEFNYLLLKTTKKLNFYFSIKKQIKKINDLVKSIN